LPESGINGNNNIEKNQQKKIRTKKMKTKRKKEETNLLSESSTQVFHPFDPSTQISFCA
jgi:lipopolysaccharide export system protein LptA